MLHVHHTQTHTLVNLPQNVRAQPTSSKSGIASVKFQENQENGGMWQLHICVCYTEQPSQWSTKDTQTTKDTTICSEKKHMQERSSVKKC